jgi:hypothetical protein
MTLSSWFDDCCKLTSKLTQKPRKRILHSLVTTIQNTEGGPANNNNKHFSVLQSTYFYLQLVVGNLRILLRLGLYKANSIFVALFPITFWSGIFWG